MCILIYCFTIYLESAKIANSCRKARPGNEIG